MLLRHVSSHMICQFLRVGRGAILLTLTFMSFAGGRKQEGPAGSQYSGQCESCQYRNNIKVYNSYINSDENKNRNPSQVTHDDLVLWASVHFSKDQLFYWCAQTASCNTGSQACGRKDDLTRCVSDDLFNSAKDPVEGGIGAPECPCSGCEDYACMHDYVNPACARSFQSCGCAQTSSSKESQIGNDVSRRPWVRGTLVCPAGSSPDATPEKLEERRKAETLLHRNNRDTLTAKRRWARLVSGRGPRGTRVWASQTQTKTTPNIRPCGGPQQNELCAADPTNPACNGCLVPKPGNRHVLVCTGRGPKLCSPNSSSDVPRSPDPTKNLICMDKNVPLTRFRHPDVVYASAGSTWPQARWAPGYAGFPVGKAGSNAYERLLNVKKNISEGTNIFGEVQSFNISLGAVPPTMCNRFSMSPLTDALICALGPGAPLSIDQNRVQNKGASKLTFSWRSKEMDTAAVANLFWKDLAKDRQYYRAFGDSPASTVWPDDLLPPPPGSAGSITINEPLTGQVSNPYEAALLQIVAEDASQEWQFMRPLNSDEASKSQAARYNFTCCGSGAYFDISKPGQRITLSDSATTPAGQLWYSGALNWTPPAPGGAQAAQVDTTPSPVPPLPTQDGYKFVSVPYGESVDDHVLVDEEGRRTMPLGVEGPSSMDLGTSVGGPNIVGSSGWDGIGCGQPGTTSTDGPQTHCEEYECNTKKCPPSSPSEWTTTAPSMSTDLGYYDDSNPHRAGGVWNPICQKCPDTSNPDWTNAGLKKDGAYITITFNFGAFHGNHAIDKGTAMNANGLVGMGQWAPWAPLGQEQPGTTVPSKSRGLTPELYTATWFIGIDTLTLASAANRVVDAWMVVVGKPSTGQMIDPRPMWSAVVDEVTGVIDPTQIGGGAGGALASLVGTQAGGLGMRGVQRYPAIDVFKSTAKITLCQ